MQWFVKQMTLQEWSDFQEKFEALYVALGGPADDAVFERGDFGSPNSEIFVTSKDIAFQALCPGAWQEAAKPSGPRLHMLIGHHDFCERHGIDVGV